MDRCANVNRTVLVAFCGLLAATPVYADSEHKAKPASSHEDQDAILRHKLRDTINTGLVGIVSEGTDYTTDLALTLAAEQNGLRSLSIPRDARGHFETEGRIEGQRIGFMVDTGASVIALNETSAARFGLRPSRGDYKASVATANGNVRAAPTRLAMVDIGGIVVRDVDAIEIGRASCRERVSSPV